MAIIYLISLIATSIYSTGFYLDLKWKGEVVKDNEIMALVVMSVIPIGNTLFLLAIGYSIYRRLRRG